jgi:hypothetical protein
MSELTAARGLEQRPRVNYTPIRINLPDSDAKMCWCVPPDKRRPRGEAFG